MDGLAKKAKIQKGLDYDGNTQMQIVRIELACARCKAKGTQEDCNHLIGEIPWWHSRKNHARYRLGRSIVDDDQ